MTVPATIPDDNAPLRLADAVALAFPNGGLTVSGLLVEAAKGRLTIEKIAGKRFVTLAAIREMRRLCQEQARGQGSSSGGNGETPREPSPITPPGLSGTDAATLSRDAVLIKLQKLNDNSNSTSRRSTNRSVKNRTSKAS